jgi:hypothetical protein
MIGKNPIIKLNMEMPVKTAKLEAGNGEEGRIKDEWQKIELCIDVKIMQARRR